ncbi:signal peptidase I [Paraherbaspirillum soli]|uniref:Signal peptidase I n=1 Tax=Paraherbaspirillum soli TaxID=631222 RepID=A0ABW0MEJ4_9BURK
MLTLKKVLARNKVFLILVVSMAFARSAIADWYEVPSGSMYPTLMIGDRIFSNRVAYDVKLPFTDIILKHIADPQRGDVVTFSSPKDGVRLVKRLIAVPGDVVEMRGERLFINNVAADYVLATGDVASQLVPDTAGRQLVLNENLLGQKHPIIVLPEYPAARSFGPIKVPAGEYMMLGDNRDNSEDSRYIGFVRRELLTGQVERVLFSLDSAKYYLPRLSRFGAAIL